MRELIFAKMEEGVAVMRLDKHIGPPIDESGEVIPNIPFISGSEFAAEMEWLKKNGKNIQVRINTPGGNVGHGWTIFDCVAECQADTHCYGLAASMGAMIMLAGKKRTMDQHASLMFHGPSQPSGKKSAYAGQVRDGFKTILESTTKLPKEKIEAIMASGDHYFNAEDAMENGIIDKIIPSKVKIARPVNASIEQLVNVYATLENQNMETPSWLNPIFGGNSDAENMKAAMKMKTDLEAATKEADRIKTAAAAEKTLLEARIQALEAKIKESEIAGVKEKASLLIKKAVADKKLVVDAAKEAELIAAAEKDYATIETMINSMSVQKQNSVVASIKDEKGADRTYEELAASYPDVLSKIQEEQPELFNKLADDYLKRMKK